MVYKVKSLIFDWHILDPRDRMSPVIDLSCDDGGAGKRSASDNSPLPAKRIKTITETRRLSVEELRKG
jgi:hypothetical protein